MVLCSCIFLLSQFSQMSCLTEWRDQWEYRGASRASYCLCSESFICVSLAVVGQIDAPRDSCCTRSSPVFFYCEYFQDTVLRFILQLKLHVVFLFAFLPFQAFCNKWESPSRLSVNICYGFCYYRTRTLCVSVNVVQFGTPHLHLETAIGLILTSKTKSCAVTSVMIYSTFSRFPR